MLVVYSHQHCYFNSQEKKEMHSFPISSHAQRKKETNGDRIGLPPGYYCTVQNV